MNLVVVIAGRQIFGDGDALVGVIAEPSAGFSIVEVELPPVVEVQSDERFSPHAHSGQFSHLLRLIDGGLTRPHMAIDGINGIRFSHSFDGCGALSFSIGARPCPLAFA